MSGVCEVLSCNSNYEQGRTYHRFPNDLERRKEWLKILGLKPKDLKTVSAVCSRHFRSKDYEFNKRLFSDAVPSLRLNKVTKQVQSSKTKHGKETNKHHKANLSSKKLVKLKKQNFKVSSKIQNCSKFVKLESLKNYVKQPSNYSKSSRKEHFLQSEIASNPTTIKKSLTTQIGSKEGNLDTTSKTPLHKTTSKEFMRSKLMRNISQPKLHTRQSLQTDAETNKFQTAVKTKQNHSLRNNYALSPVQVNSKFSKKCNCCTENMVESISSIKPQKRSLEQYDAGNLVKKRKTTTENLLSPKENTKAISQRNDSPPAPSLSCNLTHIEQSIVEMQNKIKQLEQKSILDEKKIETFKNALIEQRRNDIKTLMDEKENELLLRMDLLYMDYDPKRICRLCLVLVDKKESLTSLVSHPKNQALISLIRNATNIQIELEDGLPSGICSECLYQIKRIDWIQRKTYKSNKLIKKFVVMRKNLSESSSTASSSVNTLGAEKLLLSENLFDEVEEEEGTDEFKIEDVFSLESSSETIPFDETTLKQEIESDEEIKEVSLIHDLHFIDPIVPVRRKRTCKQCQTEFTNCWTWANHFKYCNKRFQCSECNKRFWNARLLRNHKMRRQSCMCAESLRCCYDCQIVFRWKWKLVFHVLQHESDFDM